MGCSSVFKDVVYQYCGRVDSQDPTARNKMQPVNVFWTD